MKHLTLILIIILLLFVGNVHAKEQSFQISAGNINAIPSGIVEATISYHVSELQPVNGFAFRLHYRAADIDSIETVNYFNQGHLGIGNPVDDINDLDNNVNTDKFIVVGWFDPINSLELENDQSLFYFKFVLSTDDITFSDLVISPIPSPSFETIPTIITMEGEYVIGDFVTDNDGLDDAWEMQYFNNLDSVPEGDNDHDGLTNLEEYQLGTNPTEADSDNDNYIDSDEVTAGSDPLNSDDLPLDTDGDFISNATDIDDDNDGVPDSEDFYPLDPEKSEDDRIALNIYAPQSIYSVEVGETVTIPVMYQASDDSQISSLSFKLYFNSQLLQWNQVTNLISTGLLGGMDTVYDDADDSDNNALTDSYLQVTWFDVSNNWPGESGESKLFDIEFVLLQDLIEGTTGLTIIGDYTGISTGYKVVTEPINVAKVQNSFTLDVNGDGKVSLPIDGFIILRSMVGFPASALASNDDMFEATRTRDEMADLLDNAKSDLILDINGDGKVSLPVDGFIILRHMVGFPASALASDEDMADATRTRDEMKSYMESFQ